MRSILCQSLLKVVVLRFKPHLYYDLVVVVLSSGKCKKRYFNLLLEKILKFVGHFVQVFP